jgi:transmembrane sensor
MFLPFGKRRRCTREEALVWLARLKRGLRQSEGPELLAWLKRRSRRRAIAKAAVEWHGPEVLAVLSEIFPIPPSILERRPRPILLAAGAFVAACMTVLIPTGIVLWTGVHSRVYAAADEATQRLALEDGTRVALNRGTKINVIYAVHATSVSLRQGEALFNVASAPDHPFYVHAVGQNFETSSATFDVRLASPDMLSITVLDGSVTVLASPLTHCNERVFDSKVFQSMLLKPLQRLVLESDEQSCQTLTEQDVRARLSWRSS